VIGKVMRDAARGLRRRETRSEALLWAALRDRRLLGTKWRRQRPFGPFVLDFYCEAARLALEVDGSVHGAPDVLARDRARQQILESEGIHVLRVSADVVEHDLPAVLDLITRALDDQSEPSPASRERAG